METNYKAAAKFYGILCVILLVLVTGLFIMYSRSEGDKASIEKPWKRRCDSLDSLYKGNAQKWEKFEKESAGYYFVNPKDQKVVKGFKLSKFIEL